MKFTLTEGQQKRLEDLAKNNIVAKWMRVKDNLKFSIGDVLLMYTKTGYDDNESWTPVKLSSGAEPQRYVYVYEDEFGIGYIKPLKVTDGGLGTETICLTDMNWNWQRLEVDPEYAEHMILDAEFDIKKIHQKTLEKSKQVAKMNRKIGVRLESLKQKNEFFESLNIGDTFYVSNDFVGNYVQHYRLDGFVSHDLKDYSDKAGWWFSRYKEKNSKFIDDDKVLELKLHHMGHNYDTEMATVSLDGIFFKQEPVKKED